MLSSLDREPGGWRQRLAFLESAVLAGFASRSVEGPCCRFRAPPPSHVIRAARPKSHWLVHVRTAMAMAACFMAALLIGSLLPRSGGVPTASAPSSTIVRCHESVRVVAERRIDRCRSRRGGESIPEPRPTGAWRLVTLSPSDRDGSAGVPGSGRRAAEHRRGLAASVPPAIPDDVLQALQRTGHEVQQQRQFVPVPMKDGRGAGGADRSGRRASGKTSGLLKNINNERSPRRTRRA